MGYLLTSPSTNTTTAIRSPAASMTIRVDRSSGLVSDDYHMTSGCPLSVQAAVRRW